MRLGERLLKDYGLSPYQFKENITVWLIWHRSSEGYYNYKKIALVVVYPDDSSDMFESDSRDVVGPINVYTGAYQEFSDPREVISAIKYLARKYKLHCRIVKLDWYYHFVSWR